MTRSRPLILVVDDEASIRDLLGDVLQDLGYDVETCPDGERGVEAVARRGAEVRLAIVDYVLPGMGGIETLRAMRAIAPDLPAILSSGYENPPVGGGSLEELGAAEGFSVLTKPYKIDALAEAVERAIRLGV